MGVGGLGTQGRIPATGSADHQQPPGQPMPHQATTLGIELIRTQPPSFTPVVAGVEHLACFVGVVLVLWNG
ncbi:hypothetical protein [Nonomuraea sp. B19D2]|uniref:hypothetical protein n=1 Tax=Nonomuraea sp. B19D2 TaxID=3159561 RepID=UPI0032D9F471